LRGRGAAEGYPGSYLKGVPLRGLDDVAAGADALFHAGTSLSGDDVVSSGGRVLAVTALGGQLGEAVEKAYLALEKLDAPGMRYRRDIAHRAFNR
jgi:phosphoribosylamine--glycine ligase